MQLVIVESPTKAKTIQKILGKSYEVRSSFGHVRDLPASEMGVDIEGNFAAQYIIPTKAKKVVTELKKLAKDADDIYFATDEDREGEAISWHLAELLKVDPAKVKRVVFHEITEPAIKHAFQTPRALDQKLVDAQQARRVLDRLVGYTLSPLIWKKIAYGLSAGRVQSVALKALVDVERERMAFHAAQYWGIAAIFQKEAEHFGARLTQVNGKRIATSKDFDEKTGKLQEDKAGKVEFLSKEQAQALQEQLPTARIQVESVDAKEVARRPAAPFITSTLQQEANRKLGLAAKETMRLAQNLYEHGHITYMRTDSTNLSELAVQAARKEIESRFGKQFLSPEVRQYATKAKGAQEAHEAIRPSLSFATPDSLALSGKEKDLYELIWMRTLATQMAEARLKQVSVAISAKTSQQEATFSASGTTVLFPGFLRAYKESHDETENEDERSMPELTQGDALALQSAEVTEHETKPPARYTEASLIKFMESEGIGRPSTYASIVSTILDRGYCRKQGNALVPSFTGFVVTSLLENHFQELVDKGFTSHMENSLDEIAEGKQEYTPYLKNFYLGADGLLKRVEKEEDQIKPEKARTVELPHLKNVRVKVSKFGPYLECLQNEEVTAKANLPPDIAPDTLTEESALKLCQMAEAGPQSIGTDPESGLPITVRMGSYGPYLQIGEMSEDKKVKPKRASIPKGIDPQTITMEVALRLLALPRVLGQHPESGKDIKTNYGRFGPYVQHGDDYRSLKGEDTPLTVTLEKALKLLAQPKMGRGRRSVAPLKVLGEHPKTKEPVEIRQGPYGIYIKHQKTNVTLPKEKTPETITLEEAIQLVNDAKKSKKSKK